MFSYRLHSPDGDDLGEATYPDRVKVGEELFFGPALSERVRPGERRHVVDRLYEGAKAGMEREASAAADAYCEAEGG